MHTPSIRITSRQLLCVLAASASVLGATATQAADVKSTAPTASGTAPKTSAKPSDMQSDECKALAHQKAANKGMNHDDGSNVGGTKKPSPPKCPEMKAAPAVQQQ
ncbi:MAG TPA: hypothetical protein VHQ87_09385 [Rhizobacter sp.]|nr:hypothetical protein [Rhizobacter sp.]